MLFLWAKLYTVYFIIGNTILIKEIKFLILLLQIYLTMQSVSQWKVLHNDACAHYAIIMKDDVYNYFYTAETITIISLIMHFQKIWFIRIFKYIVL